MAENITPQQQALNWIAGVAKHACSPSIRHAQPARGSSAQSSSQFNRGYDGPGGEDSGHAISALTEEPTEAVLRREGLLHHRPGTYDEAPDLIAHEKQGGQCFFWRQPENPEEVERAICACCISCVSAIRYSGDDPGILRRFRELGHFDACEALAPERHKAVIRDKSGRH